MHLLHSGIDTAMYCASAAFAYFQSQASAAAVAQTRLTKDKTMTVLTQTHAKGASLSDRLQAATEALSDRIASYRLYRQTYKELNALTNRELSDLGLHRSEVRRVALETAGKL